MHRRKIWLEQIIENHNYTLFATYEYTVCILYSIYTAYSHFVVHTIKHNWYLPYYNVGTVNLYMLFNTHSYNEETRGHPFSLHVPTPSWPAASLASNLFKKQFVPGISHAIRPSASYCGSDVFFLYNHFHNRYWTTYQKLWRKLE